MRATEELRETYASLDPPGFKTASVGLQAPDFKLQDTEGQPWQLGDRPADSWALLIWIFADWCPVCHGEFRELIELRSELEEANVRVATIEAHDTYRARVMVGKELDPEYWFSPMSPFRKAIHRRSGGPTLRTGRAPSARCTAWTRWHSAYTRNTSTVRLPSSRDSALRLLRNLLGGSAKHQGNPGDYQDG